MKCNIAPFETKVEKNEFPFKNGFLGSSWQVKKLESSPGKESRKDPRGDRVNALKPLDPLVFFSAVVALLESGFDACFCF